MLVLLLLTALALAPATRSAAAPYPREWEPVVIEGARLASLLGQPLDRLRTFRCDAERCLPIPFQIDERDASGEWVLSGGASPSVDEPPAIFDDNDVLVFLAADAGEEASARARQAGALLDVELSDPLGLPARHVYLTAGESDATRSPQRYVDYAPAVDLLQGKVALGFADGVPQYLALEPGGENVLDRLKIRATATFLWGLFGITRSEEDLLPEPPSWQAGPIRVIRRQPFQIRMRFGIRSPRFVSTTYFYRDFAEMPLTIRLRVPPRYFFTSITVQGGLDFRGLPGSWHVTLPGSDERLPAGCPQQPALTRAGMAGDWLAVEGPLLTIVQRLRRGPTLETVRESAWYRNGDIDDPPENAPSQCPGVGFTLADWDGVEGGVHTLTSTSYAIDSRVGVEVFLATVDAPLEIDVTPLAAR